MDRISPSEGGDAGSIPAKETIFYWCGGEIPCLPAGRLMGALDWQILAEIKKRPVAFAAISLLRI